MKKKKLAIESNWDKNLTLSDKSKQAIKGGASNGWDCSFTLFSCQGPVTRENQL